LASLARGAVSWAAEQALGAVGGAVANALTGGSDNQPTASEKMDAEAKARTVTKKGIQIKKGTSWKKTSPDIATATRQSKLASADLASARQVGSPQKQIQENKMSDLRIMIKDIGSLIEHNKFAFERLEYLQNTFMGLVNIEQNRIIKIFTVATVAFMPPTLIASLYGMNFKIMPELDWDYGYLFAITLMVLSSVITLIFFKKKNWL
jgi:hypothetical protein